MKNTVELIGYYGGDTTHALSAWTSTHRELTPEKIARIPTLLKMLVHSEPQHTSPFEKSAIHFLVTSDIATHIHIIKHRIGVSVNAESARYKELKDDKYYVPEDWPLNERADFDQATYAEYEEYHALLSRLEGYGISRSRAKESARYKLPYANQITQDVMFNFASFMHFQHLRNDAHAQLEVRQVAQKMMELVEETGAFKWSIEAYRTRPTVAQRDAEIAELKSIIAPFANVDIEHIIDKADDWPVWGSNNSILTVGDFKKAKAVL